MRPSRPTLLLAIALGLVSCAAPVDGQPGWPNPAPAQGPSASPCAAPASGLPIAVAPAPDDTPSPFTPPSPPPGGEADPITWTPGQSWRPTPPLSGAALDGLHARVARLSLPVGAGFTLSEVAADAFGQSQRVAEGVQPALVGPEGSLIWAQGVLVAKAPGLVKLSLGQGFAMEVDVVAPPTGSAPFRFALLEVGKAFSLPAQREAIWTVFQGPNRVRVVPHAPEVGGVELQPLAAGLAWMRSPQEAHSWCFMVLPEESWPGWYEAKAFGAGSRGLALVGDWPSAALPVQHPSGPGLWLPRPYSLHASSPGFTHTADMGRQRETWTWPEGLSRNWAQGAWATEKEVCLVDVDGTGAHSEDGGRTWTLEANTLAAPSPSPAPNEAPPIPQATDLAFAHPGLGARLRVGRVELSTDQGQSWRAIALPAGFAPAAQLLSGGGELWAASPTGLLRLEASGATEHWPLPEAAWGPQDLRYGGLPPLLGLARSADGTWWLAPDGFYVKLEAPFLKQAKRWPSRLEPLAALSGGRAVRAKERAIWWTEDGGTSWQSLSPDQTWPAWTPVPPPGTVLAPPAPSGPGQVEAAWALGPRTALLSFLRGNVERFGAREVIRMELP